MSNQEQVKKLEKEISELESLLTKYQDSLNRFMKEFKTDLPNNSFHKILIRCIQRDLDNKTNLYLALV